MHTYLLFTILGLLLIIFLFLIFKAQKSKEDILLHQKLDLLKEDFSKSVIQSQHSLLDSSRAVTEELGRLYEKLGGLDKESGEILTLARSFHDILKPAKARGLLGESILENLLKDVLPVEVIVPQYGFRDGKRVDFVIRLPSGLVPIDAKFSLETFRNFAEAPEAEKERQRRLCIEGIKKRIVETASYIYPDEGTVDFSLMYVPSEAVYYFIVTETQLLEFAQGRKVFVVGPNTLYAYLKTILIGFQALKIEERAKIVYNNLKRLEKDLAGYTRDFEVLGTHLRSATSKYEEAAKKIDAISGRVHGMGGEGGDYQSEGGPQGQNHQS